MKVHTLELKDYSKHKSSHVDFFIYSNELKSHLPDSLLNQNKCTLVYLPQLQRWGVYNKQHLHAVSLLPKLVTQKDKDLFSKEEIELSQDFLNQFFLTQLKSLEKNKSLFDFKTSEAYRLAHGEADFIPGIVIDHYGSALVIQARSAVGEFLIPFVSESVLQFTHLPLFERSTGQNRAMEGLPERTRWLRPASTTTVSTQFANLTLTFDVTRSQKTGLFLDQRLNLRQLQSLLKTKNYQSMLDICSYMGAWSSAGATEGISKFTLIDTDKRALEQATKNIETNFKTKKNPAFHLNTNQANDLSEQKNCHIFPRHGDMFEELSVLNKEGIKFDVVVADPPAFAKSKKNLSEAKRAYTRLARLASKLVNEDGIFVICSCSKLIEESVFVQCILHAFQENRDRDAAWIVIGKGLESPCHTRALSLNSDGYLKCLFLQKRKLALEEKNE